MRLITKLVCVGLVLSLGVGFVYAQDAPEVIAEGLNQPRHLFYGSDGTLYIAEAGSGGDIAATGAGGSGDVAVGLTGQISSVSTDGEWDVLIPNLLSTADPFAGTNGANSVFVGDEALYVVLGQGPSRDSAPEAALFSGVLRLDAGTLELNQMWDLLAFEEENNPDGTQDLASNPTDVLVAADGTIYAVDASGNSLLRLNEDGTVELVASWAVDDSGASPAPVPTSVAEAPDGSLYVSFLSGYPFLPGAARIEHWADGALAGVIQNLTLVTDVQVGQDGNLYAVQFADGFGDMGYNANSGSVIQINAQDNTVTTLLDGLNFPYGLAQAPDGSWALSVNSAFVQEADSGQIIRIPASS